MDITIFISLFKKTSNWLDVKLFESHKIGMQSLWETFKSQISHDSPPINSHAEVDRKVLWQVDHQE